MGVHCSHPHLAKIRILLTFAFKKSWPLFIECLQLISSLCKFMHSLAGLLYFDMNHGPHFVFFFFWAARPSHRAVTPAAGVAQHANTASQFRTIKGRLFSETWAVKIVQRKLCKWGKCADAETKSRSVAVSQMHRHHPFWSVPRLSTATNELTQTLHLQSFQMSHFNPE